MKSICRLLILSLFLVHFGAVKAESRVDLSGMNYLENVTTRHQDGELVLRFEFKNPVGSYEAPVLFQKSIQIDVPNAYVEPAKRYFRTGDSQVWQVFAAQFDRRTLRLRLMLGDEAENISEKLHWEEQGRALILRINKNNPADILDNLLSRTSRKIENKKEITKPEREPAPTIPIVKSASMVPNVESTPFSKLSPAEKVTEKQSTQKSSTKNDRGMLGARVEANPEPLGMMSTGVRMLTMLSLVLGLMFLLFYGFKKVVLKNTVFGEGEKLIQVLGTGFIAPKKNIALVEVAGEILVLGVSNDNISLLSNIQDEERIEKIKKAGQGGGPFGNWKQNRTEPSSSKESSAKDKVMSGFSKYLKQFSGKGVVKDPSVEVVKEQIRRNLGRVRTA